VHAVPASRRSKADSGLILTTVSIARGKQVLFNGHLRMEKSVVTSVGRSGRLCKLQDEGEKFVDPTAIPKAWRLKLAPGLTVTRAG
jgi:hypothetical protein